MTGTHGGTVLLGASIVVSCAVGVSWLCLAVLMVVEHRRHRRWQAEAEAHRASRVGAR